MTILTIDEQVQFTTEWWAKLCKDDEKMVKWLQKLYHTELDGYVDWINLEDIFSYQITDRTKAILTNIANDELKHSNIISELLSDRGYSIIDNVPKSQYWDQMNINIVDLNTACAVNYYGEALAAFRFEVLVEHPDTPRDIKNALGIILPDEQFHRETLKRLAGDEALSKLREKHDQAMANLRKN